MFMGYGFELAISDPIDTWKWDDMGVIGLIPALKDLDV